MSRITAAMIMGAGMGSRMRPLAAELMAMTLKMKAPWCAVFVESTNLNSLALTVTVLRTGRMAVCSVAVVMILPPSF